MAVTSERRNAGLPGNVPFQRVVIVEDEGVLRRIVARNLRARGFEVIEAATAEDAIRAALTLAPDLMLLDINLPDRTGWDVLRVLRERQVEVPTIVVSAVRIPACRLDEFKPLAYLPKPFPLDSLLSLVVGFVPLSDASAERL